MSGRRYSEKEIGEVLRRAAEMQASEVSDSGASADEIRAAAREIGIAPEYVDRALAARAATRPSTGFWGGPVVFEESTDCASFPDGRQWEETVSDLRQTFGEEGVVVSRESALEWTGTGGGFRTVQLTLRETETGTRATVTVRSDGMAFFLYFVFGFASVVLSLTLARFVGPTAMVLWPILTWLGARTTLLRSTRAHQTRAQDVLARLAQRLPVQEGSAAMAAERGDISAHA